MEFIGSLIAENEVILVVMFVLMALDIVSGLVKAFATGTYKSSIMRTGLYHKIAYIILVVVAATLQATINVPDLQLGFDIPVLIGTCSYIIMTEFMSIMENLSVINPDLAKFTSRWLQDVEHDASMDKS